MCGIVGLTTASPLAAHERAGLAGMRDTLRHRGPDDAGEWWSADGRVGLAHRRLAIIDLSPGGHQPMADVTGGLVIVFNGEIYNYRELRDELLAKGHTFRTQSDTEVILESYRAWGADCLAHLNGMFAFALYDTTARRLFLARDRAGEKPLFYHYANGRFAFASELKALMADPAFARKLDLDSFEFYLAYGWVPGERCILQGVRKLPAAHALTLDLEKDALRVWRYWQLPPQSASAPAEAEELTLELEHLLGAAVRRQLVADVPVGILLSGGLDSSLVTALAARVSSKPVRTYTISFPGHGAYDEGPYARMVAQHFGTEHTELAAEPTTVELLPELARQYDEPLCDPSMIPTYLVSKLIRRNCTVALGGDGGDELFGGYMHYSFLQRRQSWRRWLPGPARGLMARAAAGVLPAGLRGRDYFLSLAGGMAEGFASINLFFDRRIRERLLGPLVKNGWKSTSIPEAWKTALCESQRALPEAAMVADFNSYLADDILVKVDRASMLTALEVRAPFLDYRIIEFAFSRVPNRLRATESERKILPRQLAARLLPKEMDLRRKQGFSLPLNEWFKGEWGRYVEEVLNEAGSAFFDQRTIQSLIAGQRKGYGNTERIFALTLFELWRREYKVKLA